MIIQEITNLLEPSITALGYELWACEYLSQGRHSLLRVYIDKPEGINIEDCAIVTRQINALLDVHDPISGNYTLEVSSPGIDRPLFTIEHFKRYIGSKILIKFKKPVNNHKKVKAVLNKVENDTITVMIDNDELKVPLSNIIKTNLVV